MATDQPTIASLANKAERSLREYCDTTSRYAWPHYDIDNNPCCLSAVDLLAPALLSYPIPRKYIEQMLLAGPAEQYPAEVQPYVRLGYALRAAICEETLATNFSELDACSLRDNTTPGWGPILRALEAVWAPGCSGLTSVAVTKILHRKLPNLVPVIDSKVKSFYRTEDALELIGLIHADAVANFDLLAKWSSRHRLPGGRQMTALRALDIVIWMSAK